jgi:hypothetical protein
MSVPESWAKPLDLADYLSGKIPRPSPSLLTRSDGERLLYAGKVNELHGEPEAGKGFIAGQAAGEAVFAGRIVVYLDFDADPASVARRVLVAGPNIEQIQQRVAYFPISEPLPLVKVEGVRAWPAESADALEAMIGPEEPGLVIIDGVNVAMSLFGLEPKSTPDVADFMRLLVFPFRSPETPVLLVDHVVKDSEHRGRWAFGAIHKAAALDGVSFELRVKTFPAPGKVGRLALVVSKDRHGAVRQISMRGKEDVAAEVTIDGTGPEPCVRIDPATDPSEFKPTWYMEKVSEYLETCSEPVTQREIERLVGGKADYVRQAIAELVAGGYVKRAEGKGRKGSVHESLRSFREVDQ